jgi:hypothetical protein
MRAEREQPGGRKPQVLGIPGLTRTARDSRWARMRAERGRVRRVQQPEVRQYQRVWLETDRITPFQHSRFGFAATIPYRR